jgi:hypothetical protein
VERALLVLLVAIVVTGGAWVWAVVAVAEAAQTAVAFGGAGASAPASTSSINNLVDALGGHTILPGERDFVVHDGNGTIEALGQVVRVVTGSRWCDQPTPHGSGPSQRFRTSRDVLTCR